MDLEGKVALITGGGKGLGREISKCLAQKGANLVLVARDKDLLEILAEEVKLFGGKALVCPGDISQEIVVEKSVQKALESFGKIDILVNNAGIMGPNDPIKDIILKDWERTMSVNLTSSFLYIKNVIPIMAKLKRGSIINISSLSGVKGVVNRSPYCASKWAMIGMSKAVAQEVGPYNIRVNVVCPGAVEGERINQVINKRAKDHNISYEEMIEKTIEDTPLRRMVSPGEVASVVAFLASDNSSGITGEEIVVSAGRR